MSRFTQLKVTLRNRDTEIIIMTVSDIGFDFVATTI